MRCNSPMPVLAPRQGTASTTIATPSDPPSQSPPIRPRRSLSGQPAPLPLRRRSGSKPQTAGSIDQRGSLPVGRGVSRPPASAQKACAKFVGGGESRGAGPESEKLALLNLAKCMRAHGLPNFADPTTSPPPAPPPGSHTGNAVGIGGAYLVFPPQSPALKRAEGTCGFRVP